MRKFLDLTAQRPQTYQRDREEWLCPTSRDGNDPGLTPVPYPRSFGTNVRSLVPHRGSNFLLMIFGLGNDFPCVTSTARYRHVIWVRTQFSSLEPGQTGRGSDQK